jgi:hypothetical protein
MKDLFVSYEQALQLKELGMDLGWDNYLQFYDSSTKEFCDIMKDIPTPLKTQVLKWFRNVHGYCVSIRKRYFHNAETEYNYFIYPPNSNEHLEHNLLDEYDTWEEAESACIDDLIKLVKQK